jgi:cell division protein ZapA
MAQTDLHNIDIELAGRNYPILVEKEEEIAVLSLVQRLNNEIIDMQSRYGQKLNKQDILAMLLLTYAKKHQDLEQLSQGTAGLSSKIDELYLMLDAAVGSR